MGTDIRAFIEVQDNNKEWNFLAEVSDLLTRNSCLFSYFFQVYDDGMWLYDQNKPSLIPERGLPDDMSDMGKFCMKHHSDGFRHSWALWDELKETNLDEVLSVLEDDNSYRNISGWRVVFEIMHSLSTFFEQSRHPLRMVIWFS